MTCSNHQRKHQNELGMPQIQIRHVKLLLVAHLGRAMKPSHLHFWEPDWTKTGRCLMGLSLPSLSEASLVQLYEEGLF